MAKAAGKEEAIRKGRKFMWGTTMEKIEETYKKERDRSRRLMVQACLLRKQGLGPREIGRRINVPYSTVHDWLLRMDTMGLGGRFFKKRPGRTPMWTRKTARMLKRLLRNAPPTYGYYAGAWDLHLIMDFAEKRLGLTFSESTMKRILKSVKFSYRKPRPVPPKSASRQEMDAFMRDVHELKIMPMIREGRAILALDEAGCQKCLPGRRAWRPKGGDATIPISFSKQTAKMFGVLGEDGYHIKIVKSLNSAEFIEYLEYLRGIHGKMGIVLDNASCHKSKMVTEYIKSTNGDIELIFLPPYTPQLNPIEIQWRELKKLLSGRCFKSLEDLEEAIEGIAAGEMKPVKLMAYMTDRYKPK